MPNRWHKQIWDQATNITPPPFKVNRDANVFYFLSPQSWLQGDQGWPEGLLVLPGYWKLQTEGALNVVFTLATVLLLAVGGLGWVTAKHLVSTADVGFTNTFDWCMQYYNYVLIWPCPGIDVKVWKALAHVTSWECFLVSQRLWSLVWKCKIAIYTLKYIACLFPYRGGIRKISAGILCLLVVISKNITRAASTFPTAINCLSFN